ncbi:MAG: tetratricopeptide repeat protein, partial [Planctomycetes bacterium]|nr:tetratricopeptide repeat protein [Planctomycetota bacterium]
LGAVLYELLTGRPPFKGATTHDTPEQVTSQEPVLPSRLEPKLPRDLETICLKCLQKEPAKRYASAREVADDLRRFLDGEPIQARPVSPVERALRWCRRNPRVASLLAALIVVFMGGFAAVTVLWRVADARGTAARLEKGHADRQRERAEDKVALAWRAVDDMYTKVAEQWLASEPGMTELQHEFLEKALAFYQEFVQEQSNDPQVRFKTAQAYHFMARVHNRLGRPSQAEQEFRQQLALLKELTAEFPGERKYRFDLFHSYLALSPLLVGRDREAEELAQQALALIRELVRDFPDEPLFRDALAHQLGRMGGFLTMGGRLEEAARFHRDGLALARALVAEFPNRREEPYFPRNVEFNLTALGEIHLQLGELAEAEQAYREVLVIAERLADDNPDEPGHRHGLAARLFVLAELLRETGRLDEAEQLCRRALALLEKLQQDFPDIVAYQYTLALAESALGHVHEAAGRRAEAERAFQRSISINEKLATGFPEFLSPMGQLAWLLATCPVERLRDATRAIELSRQLIEQVADGRSHRALLGIALYQAGDWNGCVAALENHLPVPHDPARGCGFFLAMAYWQIGDREKTSQTYDQTIRWLEQVKWPSAELRRFRAEADGLLGLTGNGQ